MILLMMDGDLLMILTVTVNVMMMMTIKMMIMERGSCQEKNSLQFFFAMDHCSAPRSSWSFKRQALTEVTRHAR